MGSQAQGSTRPGFDLDPQFFRATLESLDAGDPTISSHPDSLQGAAVEPNLPCWTAHGNYIEWDKLILGASAATRVLFTKKLNTSITTTQPSRPSLSNPTLPPAPPNPSSHRKCTQANRPQTARPKLVYWPDQILPSRHQQVCRKDSHH